MVNIDKAAKLKTLLKSKDLTFIMEAHNGLSAKIVEEVGFQGIWASGLSMSTALGVRDNNEASWTQVLEQLEFMADATSIPILVDGDTGYGNFNNVRRLVAKLCQRDIAGVCIEDKLFPKTNSFIGESQPLAEVDEFCGRIKAGKDTQSNSNFCLVARVEALISGWPMEEAHKRATAYDDAGADAILIHSKKSDANEVIEFASAWNGNAPLIIVPTMYYKTPTETFRNTKISTIIWANHNMRAAISSMRRISKIIFDEKSLVSAEEEIVSVKDVFSLMEQKELAEAEKKYFKSTEKEIRGIVLAATQGTKLGPLTNDIPKSMVDVRGKPLLERLTKTLNDCGIKNISVVCGFKAETVNIKNINKVENSDYSDTGEVTSLISAIENLSGPCILTYRDILFRPYILESLLAVDGDIVCAIDSMWKNIEFRDPNRNADLVRCSIQYTGTYLEDDTTQILNFLPNNNNCDADGEFIGLLKLSEVGTKIIKSKLDQVKNSKEFKSADLPYLLQQLIDEGKCVKGHYFSGHWLDLDDAFDLARMRNMV
ncbi:MAG: phosphoenolpyruvate mutase [Rhodospirillaceae bacterium]|nr:phosphoenolpyruvate mutase [Rhodospirillaceae bacterium]